MVADHSRAMTFLIGEGVKPGNEGAGYVLRRIMRRAVRHLRLMGIDTPVLAETCGAVVELMGAAYPLLVQERERILGEVQAEEAKFARTLEAGTERLAALVEAAGPGGTISGDDAFRLHDTFGFPIDLTVEIAAESDVTVDRAGLRRGDGGAARAIARRAFSAGWRSPLRRRSRDPRSDVHRLSERDQRRRRCGPCASSLADGQRRSSSTAPRSTPRVVGRSATRVASSVRTGGCSVEDTQRRANAIVHLGRDIDGGIQVGETVQALVNERRRVAAARNHTGTHLLHRALRDVLGEQAKQAGSWVGPEGLRFDFPASGHAPREALRQVERIVNAQIRRNAAVDPDPDDADRCPGPRRRHVLRREVPAESVRVVQVDGYSKELCGGTHVAATGQIGAFVITGESSIGAGLRRIEAVTGEAAAELVSTRLEALRATAQLLGEREENVPQRVEALLARLRDAEKAEAPEGEARRAWTHQGRCTAHRRRATRRSLCSRTRRPMRTRSAGWRTTCAA